MEKLQFEIHKYSSYSGSYAPSNVFRDSPSDQTSRWSSDSNHPPQFLVLRLPTPAIVKFIKFGKFEKTHVCNLKRFKVYGGLTEESLIELLETGLKNDPVPETFELRHQVDGRNCFPIQFIKIVPLQSWGPSFNFSIWYVELIGDDRSESVLPSTSWYKTLCQSVAFQYKETEGMRLCLKFLRDRGMEGICEEIQSISKIYLEHPVVSDLHHCLVSRGDFCKAEELIFRAAKEGLYEEYVGCQPYRAVWKGLHGRKVVQDSPGMRGGHQMVIDPPTGTIYLFGGWDGTQDLSDFWSYDRNSGQWTCISVDAEAEGGPSPRSCHKLVFDPCTQQIFVLGKYVDANGRASECLKSDFYAYHIPTNSWHQLSEDTSLSGGPRLVYDHQMALDIEQQMIYCFGGRILLQTPSTPERRPVEPEYSGLYSYHIPTNSWKILLEDSDESPSPPGCVRSRIGHAMLFHPASRSLLILAGQRGRDTLADFSRYRLDTESLEVDLDELGKERKIPSAGFTQRATIDQDLQEVYVLSGVSKERKEEGVRNSFWVYSLVEKKWSCVYQNDAGGGIFTANNVPTKQQMCQLMTVRRQYQMELAEPCPRFAHQLVYSPSTKKHFLFGGNPGKPTSDSGNELRLDDFWELSLKKPSLDEILRGCQWELRRAEFLELAAGDPVKGLEFLQERLTELVPENDEGAQAQLHELTKTLFEPLNDEASRAAQTEGRLKLFSRMLTHFPKSMTPPEQNLVDLVPI